MSSLVASSASLSRYGDDDDSATKISVTVPFAETVPSHPSIENQNWSNVVLEITKDESDHSDNDEHPYLVRRNFMSEYSDNEEQMGGDSSNNPLRAKLKKRISKSERDVSSSTKSKNAKTSIKSSKSKPKLDIAKSSQLIVDDTGSPWADLNKRSSISAPNVKGSVKSLDVKWKMSKSPSLPGTEISKATVLDSSTKKSDVPEADSKVFLND
jgi:hypothetical protein